MSTPTAQELIYLRQQPQQSDLFLSIYKPPTVWAARVNDAAITKGTRVITFDGITTAGTPVKGQTLYVGTTLGGKEKGITFVVKPVSGSTITVAENSHINWADNDYLTVVDFFEIWPLYPRITVSGSYIQVFMNYDEAYNADPNGQNVQEISMICMGPHHAGFLDIATQQHRVYFTYDGTDGLAIGSASYEWFFESGTPAYYSGTVAGYVTWNAPGHYTARLKITCVNGGYTEEFNSYRHISIYDRPGEGPDVPILKWGMDSLSGSRDEGGYTAKLWVDQNTSDVVDGALAIIFSDDWYGSDKVSISGNATNRLGIVFIGYIMGDTIKYDYQKSRVTFSVGSPTMVMKKAETFSMSLEDSIDPNGAAITKLGSPWYYRYLLSIKAGLFEYIHWYTTLNLCTDVRFQYPANINRAIKYFDVDKTSIYDAMQTFIRTSIYGDIVSDRQGVIWMEKDATTLDVGYGTMLNMDKMDWVGEPEITENMVNPISHLEAGGVNWPGDAVVPPSSTPYLSIAPGATPAYRGTAQRLSGLAVDDQAELNTLSGNIYAKLNARYPQVNVDIVGNYQNLDIAPFGKVKMTLLSSDNIRGLSWSAKDFLLQSTIWTYDDHLLRPMIVLSEFTQGIAGDTVTI